MKLTPTKRIMIQFRDMVRDVEPIGKVKGHVLFCGDFVGAKIIGTGAFAEIGQMNVNADGEFCTAHKRELHAMFHCADELFERYGHD